MADRHHGHDSGHGNGHGNGHGHAHGGHEPDVISYRAIFATTLAMFMLLIVVFVSLAWFMGILQQQSRNTARRPELFREVAGQYPGPRLEARSTTEIERYRAELAKKTGYGWVDQKAGVARIPVERAIDILAKRSAAAPANAPAPAPAAAPAAPPAAEPKAEGARSE